MKLNCKVGDLAVIVNGENAGRFVEVLVVSRVQLGWWVVDVLGAPAHGIDDRTGFPEMSNRGHICDSRLRPIRDQPGDDETLAWAGFPGLADDVARWEKLADEICGIPA